MALAAWTLTGIWQLARLPVAPQSCGATATDIPPSLGTDASSITQAVGLISDSIRSQIRRCTGTGFQVDCFTNCRFYSLPSGSLEAMAWTDVRGPSSINPHR